MWLSRVRTPELPALFSAQIAETAIIEQEACPGQKRASWPHEDRPLSAAIAHEIRVGEAIGRSRMWEENFPFGYGEGSRSGFCDSRCAKSVVAGVVSKKGPSQAARPWCRVLPQTD
jgi:hypothetical protein